MAASRSFSEAEYLELSHLFGGGDISRSSKKELERFAVMLSRPNAFTHFGAASFPQICETVRTLLIVRMSEEQNQQAKRESRLALVIAVVALLAGIVQAVVSVDQWALNKPTQVEASTPVPVRAPLPIAVTLDPQRPAAASAPVQSIATPVPSTRTQAQSSLPPSAASKGASK
ncbi:hypothetical protein [Acidovorax radicis]|jgi:hypothetical protein|uniref:hypothetical protein n=1 Tax=Acidovorax radicis TaxID=758826 RepID=UPI001CFACE9D|nr:hypothetical protein [Acidovorax radicis]UCV00699.1 hypothetical protein KI609_08085 [Acidovorax radicis]